MTHKQEERKHAVIVASIGAICAALPFIIGIVLINCNVSRSITILSCFAGLAPVIGVIGYMIWEAEH